jgi:hypothetical protein
MRLTLVKKSSENYDCWHVLDAEGKGHIVDLCVDNDAARSFLIKGAVVDVDYLFPHVEIAMGVKEIKPQTPPNEVKG